ncbi:MAG: glycosyltransferase [bacterium]
MKKQKILLASNVAYYPSVGGSEMVLQKILEGVQDSFDRVVVFVPKKEKKIEIHNNIEIHPYSMWGIRLFALKNRPAVYFPNMVHSPVTYKNIAFVSKFSQKTIVNLVGGYFKGTKLAHRKFFLDKVRKYANLAVHVDPLSVEYLIDRAINPKINFKFITQGLDFNELDQYKNLVGQNNAKPYFIYAHNLWKWKAPDIFLNKIVAKAPELNFKIIASSTTGNFINETVNLSKNFENIEVLLGLNRNDFISYIAGSSGIISTSAVEGAQPNILLEAGYLGIPYFSLCPGQNYGHYPHVEMFENTELMLDRLKYYKYDIFKFKENCLQNAKSYFSQSKYSWDSVIEEFRKCFCV